jgi:two-component system phosphate regulon sensor histidine kinase PhoR
LDNAIKYGIKPPEISVYTRNIDGKIVISVIDNGIGIAAKEQKLIFERFYRVSTGNLHDVKGFGLGLSYVKQIVDAHNGKIEVESTLDKGSRFDIVLPLMSKKQKVTL